MYSQNNEQQIICDYFGSKHIEPEQQFFIDIGAYDPETFSNVRRLVELGWGGVFVEPSQICQKRFMDFYGEAILRPMSYGEVMHEVVRGDKLILLPCLITEQVQNRVDGMMPFYESGGDALSTISQEHKTKWETGYPVKYTTSEAPAFTMKEFFFWVLADSAFANFSFLNIDVEGINLELFDAIPEKIWQQIQLLCIEHDGHTEHMKAKADQMGFVCIGENPENLIFAKP